MKKYQPGNVILWRGLNWIVLNQGTNKGQSILRVVHIASEEKKNIELTHRADMHIVILADNVKNFLTQIIAENI